MKFGAVVVCAECHQPIVWGAGWVYICFKIPGKEGYHFFRPRSPDRDCWEGYLKERK
jgi:hypothetical protein